MVRILCSPVDFKIVFSIDYKCLELGQIYKIITSTWICSMMISILTGGATRGVPNASRTSTQGFGESKNKYTMKLLILLCCF
jgi:hypothetical protein